MSKTKLHTRRTEDQYKCPHGFAPGLCFEQPCFRDARGALQTAEDSTGIRGTGGTTPEEARAMRSACSLCGERLTHQLTCQRHPMQVGRETASASMPAAALNSPEFPERSPVHGCPPAYEVVPVTRYTIADGNEVLAECSSQADAEQIASAMRREAAEAPHSADRKLATDTLREMADLRKEFGLEIAGAVERAQDHPEWLKTMNKRSEEAVDFVAGRETASAPTEPAFPTSLPGYMNTVSLDVNNGPTGVSSFTVRCKAPTAMVRLLSKDGFKDFADNAFFQVSWGDGRASARPSTAPPCTCGSGGHPRECAAHPLARELHCAELSLANVTEERDELAALAARLRSASDPTERVTCGQCWQARRSASADGATPCASSITGSKCVACGLPGEFCAACADDHASQRLETLLAERDSSRPQPDRDDLEAEVISLRADLDEQAAELARLRTGSAQTWHEGHQPVFDKGYAMGWADAFRAALKIADDDEKNCTSEEQEEVAARIFNALNDHPRPTPPTAISTPLAT